jgi:hypothetical protein
MLSVSNINKAISQASFYLSLALQPFVRPWPLFNFLIFYTVGRIPWTGDEPVARPLPTQNKRTQTSIPRVGLEPKIPVFERAETVHALYHAATVIDKPSFTLSE